MNPAARPLQVYLDSSDFSDLSDPVKRKPFEEVEQQLFTWRDAGLIELRYSFVHVAEFAPLTPDDLIFARRRAECIDRLCGRHTFMAHGDLIEAEARAFSSGSEVTQSDILDSLGNWMPSSYKEIELPTIHGLLTELINDVSLSRVERRQIKRKFLDPRGNIKQGGMEYWRQQLPKAIALLRRDYPLSESGVLAAQRYLLGAASKDEMEEMIIGSLRDLRLFMNWYADRWDQINPITEWLRREGSKLLDSVTATMATRDKLITIEETIGTPPDEIKKKLQGPMAGMPLRLVQSAVQKYFPENSRQVQLKEAIQYLPGTWTVAHVLAEVLRNTMGQVKTPRKGRRSDFGDAVHCAYLPYVDVFRSDGFIATLIKAAKLPFKTMVVGNLNELPVAIEAKIS